jgi:hypothetical protein
VGVPSLTFPFVRRTVASRPNLDPIFSVEEDATRQHHIDERSCLSGPPVVDATERDLTMSHARR